MNIGITHRLFLAILAAATLAVVSMFLIMRWNIDRGFHRFVISMEQTRMSRLAEMLEAGYGAEGSWSFVRDDPEQWRRLLDASVPDQRAGTPARERGEPPGQPPPERNLAHHDRPEPPPPPPRAGMRFFVLDAEKNPVVPQAGVPGGSEIKPLRHRDRVVGYLGIMTHRHLSDDRQLRFLKEQKIALSLVAGIVVLVSAGLALLLATRLVRPIRALAVATDRLAAGQFSARVPVVSADELGQLACDFNALALTLEKNEQARRQWVADISHELRTPLAVLRGEIEALQDGVRQPTPGAISSLHGEALRLGRLIDDLYQLSLSDLGALTYRKEHLDLATLLSETLSPFRTECTNREITLTVDLPYALAAPVFGDPERLRQLVANLLDNGLKYTDPPGELRVSLACRDGLALIDFQDSAPGVPESALGRLFDRLYRVEASRNRSGGGAGLGLAICRNIVEAHAGTIAAHPSPLGGVWIRISLPLEGPC